MLRPFMLIAALSVFSCGCSKKAPTRPPKAQFIEGPKPVVIVEPEGLDLTRVIKAHHLDEFKPPRVSVEEEEPTAMVLYRHRFVELDGEAPAEVIVSMVDTERFEKLARDGVEVASSGVAMVHHVLSFKDAPEGRHVGTLQEGAAAPYTPGATRVDALDMNGDGRQALLLRADHLYYAMALSLFVYRPETGQLQDVI